MSLFPYRPFAITIIQSIRLAGYRNTEKKSEYAVSSAVPLAEIIPAGRFIPAGEIVFRRRIKRKHN
jgi:hypothetical protein